MDCARFENRLTRLAAGEVPAERRDAELADLGRHASTCADCAGCADLLELLALPAAERDVAADPGAAYWETFDARLRRRLAPAQRPGASRGRLRLAAAAAALAVALLGAWALRGLRDRGDAGPPSARPSAGEETWNADWARLEGLMAEASPDELAVAFDGLPGIGGDWSTGGGPDPVAGWTAFGAADAPLFPDAEDLDPAAQRELLEWLLSAEDEERRLRS